MVQSVVFLVLKVHDRLLDLGVLDPEQLKLLLPFNAESIESIFDIHFEDQLLLREPLLHF